MSCLEKWLLLYLEEEDVTKKRSWQDGHCIAEALNKIDPICFSNIRTKMRLNASTSWVFMKGNLNRLMIAIRGYYSQYIGVVLGKDREPVLGLIARVGDQVQLEKMLQLVLGIAVTGNERAKHIGRMLSLEKELKTELLLIMKGLDLEVSLVNMRSALRKSMIFEEKEQRKAEKRNSVDSGIVSDSEEDNDVDNEQKMLKCFDEDTISIEKFDFSCQHEGFFETSFEEVEMHDDEYRYVTKYKRDASPEMKDFECQFDSYSCLTSDIIDIDEALAITDMIDVGLDPCNLHKEDASTDPIFKDMDTIQQLEEKVTLLKSKLLDNMQKASTLNEYENEIQRWKKNCYTFNRKYKNVRKELQGLKLVLKMSLAEAENLRMDIAQQQTQETERFNNLEIKLDSILKENLELQESNKELEDQLWNIELQQKRQSYYPEQFLRMQLHYKTSDKQTKNMCRMSQDSSSIVSSGFASGSENSEEQCRSSTENRVLQPYSEINRLTYLQEETERLTDLIGVMEEREEQLLKEVEENVIARKDAEEEGKEKERILLAREKQDQLGRKVKNVLLLTAAFGGVHSMIQKEMVMD